MTRDPLLLLSARLARGRAIDWDEEERTAATDELREGIRKLRLISAMTVLNRAVVSGAEDLSASISRARSLAQSVLALAPGSRWGHLQILERVGGGAFGDVYRARDRRLDREVALKILTREAFDPNSEVVREARLLAAVRHPNVVMVHGADRVAGRVGIWTEFLHGQTLEQILTDRGVLDAREAALIGIDVCGALSAAHAAGIIHQDVKLSNVMRAEGGRIVLMDFGLGGEAEPKSTAGELARRLSGTPLFMAPELLLGNRPDPRSDLYSLGVVLFALVTGSLPVEASTLQNLRDKHARGERQNPRDLRPDLAEPFLRVLDRALATDPHDRYQTAGDLKSALLDCLGASATSGVATEPRRARATVAIPHRLPAESDSFVGREADLMEVSKRFHAGARLVTLQGPGGIGKTRLAARYGWISLQEWAGGAWFCDLTEATTRNGIASAVGEGLGVPLGAMDPVEQLGHAIASRGHCLLILDNFEQVVAQAAETLAPWLARAPEARILVTSRERLKIAGEEVQVIEALSLERGVELFVERARRQRSIDLDGPEGESVRELVRLMDGIPLAIELSAARMRVMTPAQIVDRVAERFRILAGSGTGRHATLRTAIDASWEVLRPWEKAAFAQCSLFEGGFDLDAAEAVLDLEPWPEAPWVIDVLQSLVDKSLLRSWVPAEDGNAPRPAVRFGMFVSLQEFAREKLTRDEEILAGRSGMETTSTAERRHAHWFARFGNNDGIVSLDQHGGGERRRMLARDLDNLIAACRRMLVQGESAAAVGNYRAAAAVLDFTGPHAVAVELGVQVASMPLAPNDRARVLRTLGSARLRFGRLEEVKNDVKSALAIDRESGDRWSEGLDRALLASLDLYEGRADDAYVHLTNALAFHREVGDRRAEGDTIGNLGLAQYERGNLEESISLYEAALAIHREVGNRRSEGNVLASLGNVHQAQRRFEEARACFQASLAIHREVGNRRLEGSTLGNLGSLSVEEGRTEEGRRYLQEALAILREVGYRRLEGVALDHLADLALGHGELKEARNLFEAALAIHREVGNRRAEGGSLGQLGRVTLAEGGIEDARELLSKGENLLRAGENPIELGKLLCTRAELEHRIGDVRAAWRTVAEVEILAAQARPDPELSWRLDCIREVLTPTGLA